MGKLMVVNNVTLDGIMQAPARPDEDTRGGFTHGGWAMPYQDSVLAGKMGEMMAGSNGSLLLGRRTYEDFHRVWPKQKGNPFTETLNRVRKYVASRTLKEPLPWQNSVLLKGDGASAVAGLKQHSDSDLCVLGSGEFIKSLIHEDLVDEYTLLIFPIALGAGRRLLPKGETVRLRLVDSLATTKGVVIATYRRA